MHFGEIGKRYDLALTLVGEHEFQSYFGFNQTITLYSFKDADGNKFVWKTSAVLGLDRPDPKDPQYYIFEGVRRGDTAQVKATVKAHGEYKGEDQTELTRVKVISISHIPTKQEREEDLRAQQIASLEEGDGIWEGMPYRQFKEHYADCEILAGSYTEGVNRPTVDVIIRKGRLVNSGTRGKEYHSWAFVVDGDVTHGFYAVSFENAEKRCRKEFPEAQSITLHKMYF